MNFKAEVPVKSSEIASHQSIAAEKAVDHDNGRPRASSTFTFAVMISRVMVES
jgi:hypothetical protein